MKKIKPVFTQVDIDWLIDSMKGVFATKDDLKAMEERQDKKYATKKDLEPIKQGIRQLNKKQGQTIRFFDKLANYHHRRLNQLEEKAGVKPPPYLPSN